MSTHLDASEYFLADIDISVARELVERDHYAKGASNTRVYTHGLFRRHAPDVPLGVAWWLPPTKVAAQTVAVDWRHVLSLSRLVVAAEVPTNVVGSRFDGWADCGRVEYVARFGSYTAESIWAAR